MGKNDKWYKKKKLKKVNVAIVGKYISLEDSYLSIVRKFKTPGFKRKSKSKYLIYKL